MIVYLDTNIVIYAVENPAIWAVRALARLTALRANGDTFMVSDLTRMECLVVPLKAGDKAAEKDFRDFLSAGGIQVANVSPIVCDQAALIRATKNFKPMDSLHLATAVVHGADLFLTKDGRLNSFTGVTVEVLA